MWPGSVCSPSLTFNTAATHLLHHHYQLFRAPLSRPPSCGGIRAEVSGGGGVAELKAELRTCRNCKQVFNTLENHPRACRFHTAHYGGETKRKFESVHTGGTMETVGGGKIVAYWHCCGAADAFDPGCEAAPHMTYDDD